jgi:hypothetical protein
LKGVLFPALNHLIPVKQENLAQSGDDYLEMDLWGRFNEEPRIFFHFRTYGSGGKEQVTPVHTVGECFAGGCFFGEGNGEWAVGNGKKAVEEGNRE